MLRGGEPHEIWGWAWADGGVEMLEVSAGGADGWMRASLEPRNGRVWQRFSIDWLPQAGGACELAARATSPDGRRQPERNARNAIHRVAVTVS